MSIPNSSLTSSPSRRCRARALASSRTCPRLALRRCAKTGEWTGVTIIDDYGHHPVEISAVLKAARESTNGKIVAVVQPHRFTRLQSLFEEFCTCFNDADAVVVAEVYPAGEAPIPGIDRDHFVLGLRAHAHREGIPLPSSSELAKVVHGIPARGSLLVCLRAP